MKLIKNLAAALLLASALSVNVYAGDQPIPGYIPPPPPATSSETDTNEKTEVATTETPEPTLADDLWVDAVMALFSFY